MQRRKERAVANKFPEHVQNSSAFIVRDPIVYIFAMFVNCSKEWRIFDAGDK